MVEARLEVLITARNQLRNTLRELDGQIAKIRTQIQSVNRQTTTRVVRQLENLRARAKAVGLDLRGLSNRFLTLNRARLTRLINQMRALRGATIGAASAARTLRTALAPFLGLFALVQALISSVRLIAEFGQQMQVVAAISQATGLEFEDLENKARELGETTRFTARQAADGLEFLVRAGFSAQEATSALQGTLNLASAGLIDLGTSASIVSSIVRQFGIDASEATDVADILAQTAASSNVNVRQLGESFKFVGPIIASVGGNIKDTAFLLGVLGNAGIQATVAGAGLRRTIGGIVNPTKEATRVINRLLADRGGLVGLQKVLAGPTGLVGAFELLADAGLSTGEAFEIFQQRGGLIAIALTRLIGESGDLVRRFNDIQGASARISEQIEDTLLGDFRKLLSVTQELVLGIGDAGAEGALRDFTRGLTELVRGLAGAESATGKLGEAGEFVRNVFRIFFAIVTQLSQSFNEEFGPAIDKAIDLLAGLSGLAEGIVQQFKELGLIQTDVSAAVETAFNQIRSQVDRGLFEDPEASVRTFVDSQIRGLERLGNETRRLTQASESGRTNAIRQAARARIRDIEIESRTIRGVVERSTELLITLTKNRLEEEVLAATDAAFKQAGIINASTDDQIAFLDQRINLVKARAGQEAQAFRDQLAEFKAIDEQRAAEGLPRAEDFFEKRAELQARASAAEVAGAQAVLGLIRRREELRVDDLQARIEDISAQLGSASVEARSGLLRQRRELQTELDTALLAGERDIIAATGEVLNAQTARRAEEAKDVVELTKLQEGARKFIEEARAELAEPTAVQDFTVIADQIRQANQKALRDIAKDTEDAKIAERLINKQAVDELLVQVEAAIKDSNARLQVEEDRLQAEREAGAIGEIARQTEVKDARILAAEEQRRILEPIRELEREGIEITGEQTLKIIELRDGIKELGDASLPILEDIQEAFVQSFGRFLEDIISGSKSAKEAFRDFAKDVVAQIQKIIIQQVILNALRGFLPGGAPGAAGGGAIPGAAKGGLMKFAKGGLQRFAAGGPPVFKGPGTDTSDSILAKVSRGEYVMPAAITRQWLGVLEVMRSGKFSQFMAGRSLTVPRITSPSVGRFQQGGLVEPKQTVSTRGEQRGIRLINVVDPSLVRDFLISSEGEEVFFNLISKNPETVRRLIA